VIYPSGTAIDEAGTESGVEAVSTPSAKPAGKSGTGNQTRIDLGPAPDWVRAGRSGPMA